MTNEALSIFGNCNTGILLADHKPAIQIIMDRTIATTGRRTKISMTDAFLSCMIIPYFAVVSAAGVCVATLSVSPALARYTFIPGNNLNDPLFAIS